MSDPATWTVLSLLVLLTILLVGKSLIGTYFKAKEDFVRRLRKQVEGEANGE